MFDQICDSACMHRTRQTVEPFTKRHRHTWSNTVDEKCRLRVVEHTQAAATRRNLAGLLEDIGTKGDELPVVGELMGAFLQCLTAFLHDTAPAVAKRALTAGAVLFKRTLLRAAVQVTQPSPSVVVVQGRAVRCRTVALPDGRVRTGAHRGAGRQCPSPCGRRGRRQRCSRARRLFWHARRPTTGCTCMP